MKQTISIKKRELKELNGIDDKLACICGNCINYVWDLIGDRHKGDCTKRDNIESGIYLMARVPDGLHALTGAKYCDSFVLENDAELKIEIRVNKARNQDGNY